MQIQRIQNNNYNQQFKGYLDISEIKKQKRLWKAVKNKFAEDNVFTRGGLRIRYDKNERLFVDQIGGDWIEYFTEKGTKKLMSQPAEIIADTFTKLHRFIEDNACSDEIYFKQMDIWTKMQKKFPNLRTKVMKEYLESFMDEGLQIADYAQHKQRFAFYKKDPYLKDLLKTECDPLPGEKFYKKKAIIEARVKKDKNRK